MEIYERRFKEEKLKEAKIDVLQHEDLSTLIHGYNVERFSFFVYQGGNHLSFLKDISTLRNPIVNITDKCISFISDYLNIKFFKKKYKIIVETNGKNNAIVTLDSKQFRLQFSIWKDDANNDLVLSSVPIFP